MSSYKGLKEAALRHFKDAAHLDSGRPDGEQSADHLLGFAAECALKALVCLHAAKSGSSEKTDDIHINQLWPQQLTQLRQAPSLSAVLQNVPGGNPFSDWHVNQRYNGNQPNMTEPVKKHRKAAEQLLRALDAAELLNRKAPQ